MDIILGTLRIVLEEGFIYALLALGVYITYSILDFPDLSVDGTVPLGAILAGVGIARGLNPWLCTLLAFLAGALAGSVTGLLHVKLKIRPLLCGILVMTALLSVNLLIVTAGTGGASIVSFYTKPTIFSTFGFVPDKYQVLIGSLFLALLAKLLLDAFLKTKAGLLLRAAGNNQQYVVMLARDPGASKILGLSLGNGFAAMAGAVIAQQKGTADLQMGTGMVVIGLASVIIGVSLFKALKFLRPTSRVLLGSVGYKACLSIALALGLPTNYLKLLMAALFVLALVASGALQKKGGRTRA